MATGFPAPTPAVIPSNGIINANTPGCCRRPSPATFRSITTKATSQSWNIALQRQLPKNFTLEAAYVANHTVRAPVTYNLNAASSSIPAPTGSPLFARSSTRTPISTIATSGFSNNYNSLQVKVDRRFSGGFLMTTAYTLAKALGYSSEDGGFWNYIQPQRSYSRLDFDRRHTFVQSYVYELPFGKGKPLAAAAASAGGSWATGR